MVFVTLINFYLQSCHIVIWWGFLLILFVFVGFLWFVVLLGFFCRLISKISLYNQNKFSVVSPVRGTRWFFLVFISLQGRPSLFWGFNIFLSRFQSTLFYTKKFCLKHLVFICFQKLQLPVKSMALHIASGGASAREEEDT